MGKVKDAMLGWVYDVADLAQSDYGLDPVYFDTGYGKWLELWEWAERYAQTTIDATGKHPIDLGYSVEDFTEEFDVWMMGRTTDDDSGPSAVTDYDGDGYWDSDYPGGALSTRPLV